MSNQRCLNDNLHEPILRRWECGRKPLELTHVAHMTQGDFYGTEPSHVAIRQLSLRIDLVQKDETLIKNLKKNLNIVKDEIIDASTLSIKELKQYLQTDIANAKTEDVLLSLHLKATMMKVSDPIIFGHVVKVFYEELFQKYQSTFSQLKVNPNNGFNDLLEKIKTLEDGSLRQAILDDIALIESKRPAIAMVNSDKGISNLYVPSDVIVDASVPVVIRDSGKMYNKAGKLQDTKLLIPDRCYAQMYQEIISYVKVNGQWDVSKIGLVSNVGLMAQKAEEYGSHDKTFEIPSDGLVRVYDESNVLIFEHARLDRQCIT